MAYRNLFVFFILFFTASEASARLCSEIFKEDNSYIFKVFTGYPRESSDIAGRLNYPASWTYRKLGGNTKDLLPGEKLYGNTGNLYLAQRNDGSFVVLKEYPHEKMLETDYRAYQLLSKALEFKEYFIVPEVRRSERNSNILEIEYFEGEVLKDFAKRNAHSPEMKNLTRQYNQAIDHLGFQLYEIDANPLSLKEGHLKRFMWDGPFKGQDVWININSSNVLIIKDGTHPNKFRFVVIDPE